VLNGLLGCFVSGVSTPIRRTRSPFSITNAIDYTLHNTVITINRSSAVGNATAEQVQSGGEKLAKLLMA
jgi:hypothetical protein